MSGERCEGEGEGVWVWVRVRVRVSYATLSLPQPSGHLGDHTEIICIMTGASSASSWQKYLQVVSSSKYMSE